MKIKPRILRVVTDARVVPWHLGKTLRIIKDDFEIFVAGDGVSQYESSFPGITFIDLPIQPKINFVRDLQGLISLTALILKIKPNIVHSIMPKAGLLSALAGLFFVPVRLHTFTGLVWQTKSGLARRALKLLDKLVVKLNTLCMTDSFSQSDYLYQEGIKTVLDTPLPVISKGSLGGVDLNTLDFSKKSQWREEIRQAYGISADRFVIGYLARKTSDKGAILILDAFSVVARKYNHVSLMFIGPDDSGGELNKYKAEHPEWDRCVIELDTVAAHEKYLSAFDVMCLPSFREGFGSIVIDAAALAVPTIGSRIFGLTDAIVENTTGLLFTCGSEDELVDSIISLIENKDLLGSLGRAAHERAVAHFDYKFLSKELSSLYMKLLDDEKK